MHDTVIFSSFEWKILENIKQIQDSLAVALLSRKPADMKAVEVCRGLKAFSWNHNQKNMETSHVTLMHDAGARVFAYTVNSVNRFQQLLAIGVDGVFTNNPILLKTYPGLTY